MNEKQRENFIRGSIGAALQKTTMQLIARFNQEIDFSAIDHYVKSKMRYGHSQDKYDMFADV